MRLSRQCVPENALTPFICAALFIFTLLLGCTPRIASGPVPERTGAGFLHSMRALCPEGTTLYQRQRGPRWSQWCEDELDRKQGPFVQWHPSGTIALEGQYLDNLETGTWRSFYEGGGLESEGEYARGRRFGPWTWWYHNGTIWRTGHYRDDALHGRWTFYRSSGEVIGSFTMLFGSGERVRWFGNGQKMDTVRFTEGHMDGPFKAWHPNGALRIMGHFRSGEPIGTWRTWYDDAAPGQSGTPRSIGRFRDGLVDGTWTFYNEDGSTLTACRMKRGVTVDCPISAEALRLLLPIHTIDLYMSSP